jgi:hypothetical protein
LDTLESFDGGVRSRAFELDEGDPAGTAPAVARDANGSNRSVDREDLSQVGIGDLW